MKRSLLINITVFSAFVLISIFVINIINIDKHNKKIKLEKQSLQLIDFYNLDSTQFKNNNIPNNNLISIVYFSTDCEFCQAEAIEISRNIEKFKRSKIFMISPNSCVAINKFMNQYNLCKFNNIVFLWDKNNKFPSAFGSTTFPSFYIYNLQHKLIKEYHGQVSIDQITRFL